LTRHVPEMAAKFNSDINRNAGSATVSSKGTSGGKL